MNKLAAVLMAGALAALSACSEPSTSEKIQDSVNDALDRRPAEPLRDAAEDMKQAAKDAAEAVKDTAAEAAQDANEAAAEAKDAAVEMRDEMRQDLKEAAK